MQHIEDEMRMVPAPEFQVGGVTPIAVERYTDGTWKRLGYAAGFGASGTIISIEEWLSAVAISIEEWRAAAAPKSAT